MNTNGQREEPRPCRICGRDTRAWGYHWGACSDCARLAIEKAARHPWTHQSETKAAREARAN